MFKQGKAGKARTVSISFTIGAWVSLELFKSGEGQVIT
jgi:hypothetical protein